MSKPNWTERERRDHEDWRKDINFYDRRMLVTTYPGTKEITLGPAVWDGRELVSIVGPIVPLSVNDAKQLINQLERAIRERENYLDRNP